MEFNTAKYLKFLEEHRFEEAIAYRSSAIPNYIYKFYWLYEIDDKAPIQKQVDENELRFKSLRENNLWFALPEKQNDPYEFRGIYLDKKALLSRKVPEKVIDRFEDAVRQFAICCFVDNSSDNMPMWAHYANNHRGYCVKYKVKNKRALRNVLYEPEPIPITNIFLGFLLEAAKELEKDNEERDFYSMILQEKLFVKHDSWKYENEIRGVWLTEKGTTNGLNVSVTELGLEPVQIICGYKCSDEHEKILREIADVLSVHCIRCEPSETKFITYEDV